MTAIVYSGTNCVWCDRVIDLLKEHEDDITKIDVDGKEKIKEMHEACGQKVNTVPQVIIDGKEKIKEMHQACGKKVNTVPQVIIDGKHIGGYTETERYINQQNKHG